MEWKNLGRLTRSTRGVDPVKAHGELLPEFDYQPDQVEHGEYERPAIHVIGKVRDLTGGSSSSGHKDANSQYYW